MINGDVQSDTATLEFKNREQLEYFHRIFIRLQEEINLSGETVYPTRLIFHYMKEFSNSYKIKAFIAPKMTYLITLLYNKYKPDIYTGGGNSCNILLSRNYWVTN